MTAQRWVLPNREDAMAFVPFVNTVKAELIYRQDGQTMENVLHYRSLVTPAVEDMELLAQVLVETWDAFIQPLVAPAVQLVMVRVTSLVSDYAPVVEYVTGLPLAGTLAGTAAPNNVTVVIKFSTLARGRSFRGRLYHVGLTSNSFTNNTLQSAYRTSLQVAWAAFQDLGTDQDWRLVVASRVSGGVPRTEGVTTMVSGVSVNPTLDSQRRRLPERGA